MGSWAFDPLCSGLQTKAAHLFASLGWTGVAAVLAGALLLLSLSARSMKLVTSRVGLAAIAGGLVAALAFLGWGGSKAAPSAAGHAPLKSNGPKPLMASASQPVPVWPAGGMPPAGPMAPPMPMPHVQAMMPPQMPMGLAGQAHPAVAMAPTHTQTVYTTHTVVSAPAVGHVLSAEPIMPVAGTAATGSASRPAGVSTAGGTATPADHAGTGDGTPAQFSSAQTSG